MILNKYGAYARDNPFGANTFQDLSFKPIKSEDHHRLMAIPDSTQSQGNVSNQIEVCVRQKLLELRTPFSGQIIKSTKPCKMLNCQFSLG